MRSNRALLAALVVPSIASALSSCSDVPTTGPGAQVTGLNSRHDVLPTAVDFVIPAPANSLTPADVDYRHTGIMMPPGVLGRVRLSGAITYNGNPLCVNTPLPGSGLSFDGRGRQLGGATQEVAAPQVGFNQLDSFGSGWGMNTGTDNGGGTYTWYTARTFSQATEIVYEYTMAGYGCWNDNNAWYAYSYSGNHALHVEYVRVTVVPSSLDVTPGQSVHFVMNAENYDLVAAFSRRWTFVPSSSGNAVEIFACAGKPSCDYAPRASGRMEVIEQPTSNDNIDLWSDEVLVRPAPCPPEGDPILDDPVVRRGLDSAFSVSGADLPQGQRHEHSGVIVQFADGHRQVIDMNVPNTTDCNTPAHDISSPPGSSIVAEWHTHPWDPGPPSEAWTRCGTTTFQKGFSYLPAPSPDDWTSLDGLNALRVNSHFPRIPEYVYDKRNVYRMNPNVTTPPANNHTTFVHDRRECRWL